jgi:hypothetical protein
MRLAVARQEMGYPKPTPALKGKEAKEFLKKLETFKLSDDQRERWKGSREVYRTLHPHTKGD